MRQMHQDAEGIILDSLRCLYPGNVYSILRYLTRKILFLNATSSVPVVLVALSHSKAQCVLVSAHAVLVHSDPLEGGADAAVLPERSGADAAAAVIHHDEASPPNCHCPIAEE